MTQAKKIVTSQVGALPGMTPLGIRPSGWQLTSEVRMEWRWNGNWRQDDDTSWLNPDAAAANARDLYARRNEKLTAVRLVNRNGDVVWQEGR